MTITMQRVRWIVEAESVPATQEQIRQVLALGERCVEVGCLPFPRWQGLVGSACTGPQTVAAMRELIATLYLFTGRHFPALGDELRAKSEELGALLRVSA
jgi:hypothetical protein